MHFLDLGLTQPTGGSWHNINDFCFLNFFISMKKTPYQGQKTKFCQFEQCGISLDMFERVKWPVLRNLSLISIIMRICEKNGTLSTEIGPAATKIVKFWPKKHISVQVLKTLQMSCASELKPYTINNKDRWKKFGCHNTKKPQNRKCIWKIIA